MSSQFGSLGIRAQCGEIFKELKLQNSFSFSQSTKSMKLTLYTVYMICGDDKSCPISSGKMSALIPIPLSDALSPVQFGPLSMCEP